MNSTATTKLFDSFGILPSGIEQDLQKRLHQRLAENLEYSAEEIDRVCAKSPRICGESFELALEDYEKLRVLSILSQCAVADASKISSHRKILGAVIVRAKRIVWKILSTQLENTFNGIQEFSSWMLVSHIRSLERISNLEQQLHSKTLEDRSN